ncbi:F-box/kelch-repeat protein [Trifolium pratense]|uniref:F-box/kelch-repeat protein n=1 Tax=Trifolium pratense TaxID=57577 RepID=A0A2K3NML7_TRIPR|nr:F-box/kelch-repeat protein [Trifolium pratense]
MIDETSAVNDAPTLPYNLVEEEILCRLPVKYLLQFRCVCKSWNSLISDPRFAKKHLSMSTTCRLHFIRRCCHPRGTIASCPLQCIFTNTSCRSKNKNSKKNKKKPTVCINVTQLKYPSYRSNYPPHVFVGSCNGILCLAHEFSIDDSLVVILWNPSLRKVKELPQSHYPNLSRISYGFGYDFVTDNYKVVAVLCFTVHNSSGDLLEKAVVKINTMGTNFWRNIQEFPFDSMIGNTVPGIFVSGTINWLASKCWRKSPCFIVSLDLGTESYQKLLMPDYGEVNVNFLNLCVLRDCLCIISGHDVWIMKEYGNKESWTKLFNVSYKGEPSMSNELFNAVYMFEDGQVLFESSEDGRYNMIVHDPRIGTIKYIKFQDKSVHNSPGGYDNYPIVCVESLISPCF